MTNCHSWRDAMWVNDKFWCHPIHREWQVFLSVSHPTCTLLSMSTTILVTYLRNTKTSHFHFYKAIPFLVFCNQNVFYNTFLCSSRKHWTFFFTLSSVRCQYTIQMQHFSNYWFLFVNFCTRRNDAIII